MHIASPKKSICQNEVQSSIGHSTCYKDKTTLKEFQNSQNLILLCGMNLQVCANTKKNC
jgi:hypothetical protein